MRFGEHTVKLLPKLMTRGEGTPKFPGPSGSMSGPDIFAKMMWEDWPEANLREVGFYLRGGTGLVLTPAWRAVFPSTW